MRISVPRLLPQPLLLFLYSEYDLPPMILLLLMMIISRLVFLVALYRGLLSLGVSNELWSIHVFETFCC